jgi:predicted ArsR family transcriptional regulator
VASVKERELLQALQSKGELTPAQAAMETSLTVNEADEMLADLAAKGHLNVKVRGGGLFYGLWEPDSETVRRGLEDE